MKNARSLLLAGTILPTFVVSGAGYWLVARTSPDAAFSRLWLDLGLALFLGALVVGLTQGPAKQIQRVVEMLRGISIGQRDRRLDPEQFGELEDVVRACNEVAAALSEQEDPNLGNVQRRKRTPDEAAQKADLDENLASAQLPNLGAGPKTEAQSADWRQQQLDALSEHPDIGPVRVRKKVEEEAASPEAQSSGDKSPPADVDASQSSSAETPEDDHAADPSSKPSAESSSEPPGQHVDAARTSPTPAASEPEASSGSTAPNEDLQADTPPPAVDSADQDAPPARAALHDAPTVKPSLANKTDIDNKEVPPAKESPKKEASVVDLASFFKISVESTPPAPTIPETPAQPADTEASTDAEAGPEGEAGTEGVDADPLEELFEAYVAAKKEHGESIDDLELNAFIETITEESARLRESHQCRDVRFEVRVQNGEVSLLPRLLR